MALKAMSPERRNVQLHSKWAATRFKKKQPHLVVGKELNFDAYIWPLGAVQLAKPQ
jgi:hypothetical protein